MYVSSSLTLDRFERTLSSRNDVVNSLLLIEESLIARTRDRSQDAKNINRRQAAFETFINREFSQFERVKMKIALNNQKEMTSKIQNVIHHADSASGRERGRKRERERVTEREREREQETGRERDRESAVAADQEDADQEEIVISAIEEERKRDKERERLRERERRDREQAVSK